MVPLDPVAEHGRSSSRRAEVLRAERVGCFYCLASYDPADIENWTDEIDGVGQTAICPRCSIDSVIPWRAGIDREFLQAMRDHWFDEPTRTRRTWFQRIRTFRL